MPTPITFNWYDYETFGLNTRRDRPAQYGMIRTDMDLNEIEDPIMVYCKPSPDYVPDPGACVVTGITPMHCEKNGLPEYKFAELIEREMSRENTISVGYNTLKFDSEVTRFMFFRNLIDPYAHEHKNGCGRWDLMHLVHAAYAFNIPGIKWPKDKDGNVSFRLTALTEANGISHVGAHGAIPDVRATIAMARLIRDCSPALFEYCLGLRKKDAVSQHLNLIDPKPVLQVTRHAPAAKGCVSMVMPLLKHPNNSNEVIVWDLSEDPSELLKLNAAQIRARMYVKTADLVEGTKRIPLRAIKINASPVLTSPGKLSVAAREKWGFDMPTMLANAEKCREVMETLGTNNPIWTQVYEREQEECDVDESLYSGGFISFKDRALLDTIRKIDPVALATKADQIKFSDPRLPEMLFRYRARNYPQTLSQEESVRWAQHCATVLNTQAPGRRTLDDMREIIARLIAEKDHNDHDMLEEVAQYGQAM